MNRAICPICQARKGVRLLWGYPSDEAMVLANKGEVELGGCIVLNTALDRHCLSCEHRWESSKHPECEPASGKRGGGRRKRKVETSTNKSRSQDPTSLPPVEGSTGGAQPQGGTAAATAVVSSIPAWIVFGLMLIVTFVIAGPVVCSDGWASGSLGKRGACSHHGGVSYWPQIVAFWVSAIVALQFHRFRCHRASLHTQPDRRL